MSKYEAVIRFDEKSADILTKIISSKAELVSVTAIKESVNPPIRKQGSELLRSKIKGKRISSPIKGADILRNFMSDGQIHGTKEITQEFMKHGFEKNSASPRILELVTDGEIKRISPGHYQKISRVKTAKISG